MHKILHKSIQAVNDNWWLQKRKEHGLEPYSTAEHWQLVANLNKTSLRTTTRSEQSTQIRQAVLISVVVTGNKDMAQEQEKLSA